jgi:class 3 adenylate cyclase
MRRDLPSGTVTFLFTDIEGSTKLMGELGAEAYAKALAEHRRVVRDAFVHHSGVEVDTQGDAFFYAFSDGRRRSRPRVRHSTALPRARSGSGWASTRGGPT